MKTELKKGNTYVVLNANSKKYSKIKVLEVTKNTYFIKDLDYPDNLYHFGRVSKDVFHANFSIDEVIEDLEQKAKDWLKIDSMYCLDASMGKSMCDVQCKSCEIEFSKLVKTSENYEKD